jgi:hypothetical protein
LFIFPSTFPVALCPSLLLAVCPSLLLAILLALNPYTRYPANLQCTPTPSPPHSSPFLKLIFMFIFYVHFLCLFFMFIFYVYFLCLFLLLAGKIETNQKHVRLPPFHARTIRTLHGPLLRPRRGPASSHWSLSQSLAQSVEAKIHLPD